MTQLTLQQAATENTADLAGRYLTFRLAQGQYGLPVLRIREIVQYATPTALPSVPEYVLGVLNLRGRVVPVVHLCKRLGVAESEMTSETCVVITEVHTTDKVLQIGLLVDAVSEVLDIAADQVDKSLQVGQDINQSVIRGLAQVRETTTVLLDADSIFENNARQAIAAAKIGSTS